MVWTTTYLFCGSLAHCTHSVHIRRQSLLGIPEEANTETSELVQLLFKKRQVHKIPRPERVKV